MTKIELTLGDGFTRRKQIENEINTWLNRMGLSGRNDINYITESADLSEDKIVIGTKRVHNRTFTTIECINKVKSLIEADKKMALRISLTNQTAKARMQDLEGNEVTLTIPELIVLKNEIAPKLKQMYATIPQQDMDNEIIEVKDDHIIWRVASANILRKKIINDKGFQEDISKISNYSVRIVEDYGRSARDIYEEKDKISAWEHRLKEAINQANKTPLIDIA